MTRMVIAGLMMLCGVLNVFSAGAAEVKVLSGGAVEPGLHAFADLVNSNLGHD